MHPTAPSSSCAALVVIDRIKWSPCAGQRGRLLRNAHIVLRIWLLISLTSFPEQRATNEIRRDDFRGKSDFCEILSRSNSLSKGRNNPRAPPTYHSGIRNDESLVESRQKPSTVTGMRPPPRSRANDLRYSLA